MRRERENKKDYDVWRQELPGVMVGFAVQGKWCESVRSKLVDGWVLGAEEEEEEEEEEAQRQSVYVFHYGRKGKRKGIL